MPIEYKSYGCSFRCGRRHTPSLKAMQNHESICWYNPEVKACNSCHHSDSRNIHEVHHELPGSPVETWHERGCRHPDGNRLLNERYESLKNESGWILPIVGCPYHDEEINEAEEVYECVTSHTNDKVKIITKTEELF
jgi:hypothetical protein